MTGYRLVMQTCTRCNRQTQGVTVNHPGAPGEELCYGCVQALNSTRRRDTDRVPRCGGCGLRHEHEPVWADDGRCVCVCCNVCRKRMDRSTSPSVL